jgi:hypothetical protein
VYNYTNTKAFADGAKSIYLKTIASDDKRKAMISQAEEDCGGRYEGTSLNLIELSHIVVAAPARGIVLKSYRTCLLDGYLSASQIRSTTPPRCPRRVN